MSLPTPSLDDRRFQDIVDEAKRAIPRHCPEWTDHNLSDPGIALLELFAWMTDLTLYRLNQVPDRLYTKFLHLLGITRYPAAPATADVIFWLSGPQTETVRIPAGTQVGTVRTERDESVLFMTDEPREITRPDLTACLTHSGGRYTDTFNDMRTPGFSVECFPSLQDGDALYLGFDASLGGTVVRFAVDATVHSAGVDPTDPPWVWEALVDDRWEPCRLLDDTTLALNRQGHIDLIVPRGHDALTVGPTSAFWVRCRLLGADAGRQRLADPPKLDTLDVTALGGVVSAHHAQPTAAESLGRSDGTPGQRFTVRRTPVLPPRRDETVEVVTGDQVTAWELVDDFAASGPDDHHFTWDRTTGEITFGPHLRGADGQVHRHGAVPALDAVIRTTGYRYGGGSIGNVGARTITWLKSSLPFIARVENLDPATGGVDAETVDNAKLRGPMSLRTSQRAVTVDDFERLTLEAAPQVARAHCLAAEHDGGPIRVLIIPRCEVPPDSLGLDDLVLAPELIALVSAHLDERRLLTTSVQIRTPSYQGVTVTASLRGAGNVNADALRSHALSALYAYINPLTGGPDGRGWPFGRTLTIGEVFALLSAVDGVVGVEEVQLALRDLRRGTRRDGGQRIQLPPDALFASHQHQVRVV
ncbi:MAG: putative baseplate assembly protein [Actinobacteria bacterium]|nr:putative baseplate assembly protein [Actinomycetota bacterium]